MQGTRVTERIDVEKQLQWISVSSLYQQFWEKNSKVRYSKVTVQYGDLHLGMHEARVLPYPLKAVANPPARLQRYPK